MANEPLADHLPMLGAGLMALVTGVGIIVRSIRWLDEQIQEKIDGRFKASDDASEEWRDKVDHRLTKLEEASDRILEWLLEHGDPPVRR